MRFNSNQKYTRWSIRRLSVGVASVAVASGFFVLVGHPSSVRADEVNLTPAQVVPNPSSVTEKSELPENVLKEAVDTALPENQTIPSSKEAVDETNSSEKTSTDSKEEVAKPKEEQDTPKANNPTEEQSKPEVAPATVGSQDREAPTPQSVTTPEEVKKGVAENTKETVDVPASYLEKANVPGPFLAGVNQVIPYEAFGGDGMLTRLLLKSSDKAPWSDNGKANNPALLPLEGLAKGQYFYEVDLNGNTTGKEGQALLDQLRANGTQTYQATVKVYGAKDGKPDLTNVVAIRQIMIQLHGKDMTTKSSQDNQAGMDAEKDMKSEMMGMTHGMENMKADQPGQSQKVEQMMKGDKGMLPNTGEVKSNTATIGIFGLVLAGALSLLGVKAKRDN